MSNHKFEKAYEAALKAVAKPSSSPSQAEYESNERRMVRSKEIEVDRAPLSQRKEAQAELLVAMKDHPEIVAERIDWLLDGNYGYGLMVIAKEILGSPRMNREAALTQMIGVHEWGSPRVMTVAAWKKLSSTQQGKLSKIIDHVIKRAERGKE